MVRILDLCVSLRAWERRTLLNVSIHIALPARSKLRRRSHMTQMPNVVENKGQIEGYDHSILSTSNMSLSTLSPVQVWFMPSPSSN